VVALALSGGAFASTTQSIILNLIDTTSGASYLFDTSLPTSASDPGTQSFSLSADSNYQSFESQITGGDILEYSVVGYSVSNTVDTTAGSTPTVVAGQKSSAAATQISTFLGQVVNPAGGSTYIPASASSLQQWNADYDPSFKTDIGVADEGVVGTALNFYAITTSSPSGTRNGASVAELASQWTLSAAGLLTYGSVTAVPLPASLLLLLSGVALTGLVARRRPSGRPSAEASLGGLVA
jgi:hypothetical protein